MRDGTMFDFVLLLCWNGGLYAILAILVWAAFKKYLRVLWMIIIDIILLIPFVLLVNHLR